MSTRQLHPTDPEMLACPHAYYAQLHSDERGARDEGPIGWVVGGYDDLMALGRDTKRFSSQFFGPEGTKLLGASPEPPSEEVLELVGRMHKMDNALVIADPPLLTRQKAIAIKSLNAHRVREMEPMMREIVNGFIDGWIDDGRVEFVAQFANWVPLTVICRALGMELTDQAKLKRWTEHLEAGYLEPLDNAQRVEVTTSVLEFQELMLELIAERRERPNPDLLSALVNTTLKQDDEALDGEELIGPRQLTDGEILTMTSQLFAAGNHTTTSLMANLMVTLVEHPQSLADLRADPSLIPNAIHESVRRDAPLRCLYRVNAEDAELGGETIPAGSQVMAAWGAGNHDPEVFPDPTAFDIHRPNVTKHIGFGHGPHFCIGSQLARTQTRVAFEILLERLDDIRFPADKPPVALLHMAVGGHTAVHLEFTKA